MLLYINDLIIEYILLNHFIVVFGLYIPLGDFFISIDGRTCYAREELDRLLSTDENCLLDETCSCIFLNCDSRLTPSAFIFRFLFNYDAPVLFSSYVWI